MTFTASGGLRAIPSCSTKLGNTIKTKAMAAIEGNISASSRIFAMPKAASAAIARTAVSENREPKAHPKTRPASLNRRAITHG